MKFTKDEMARRILSVLNPAYTENSGLRIDLVRSLSTKLSNNDLSSLWSIAVTSRPSPHRQSQQRLKEIENQQLLREMKNGTE